MRKWFASVVILALTFVAIGHAQRGRGRTGGPPPPPDQSPAMASRSRAGGVAWTTSRKPTAG